MPTIITSGDNGFPPKEKTILLEALEKTEPRLVIVENILTQLSQLAAEWDKGHPMHYEWDQVHAKSLYKVFNIVLPSVSAQSQLATIRMTYRAAGVVLASPKTKFQRYLDTDDTAIARYESSLDVSGTRIIDETIWINSIRFFPELHGQPRLNKDDWQATFKFLNLNLWRIGILVHEAIHFKDKKNPKRGEHGHFCDLGPLADPYGYQKFLYASSSTGLQLGGFGMMPDLAPPTCKGHHANRTLERIEHFGPSRTPGPTRMA